MSSDVCNWSLGVFVYLNQSSKNRGAPFLPRPKQHPAKKAWQRMDRRIIWIWILKRAVKDDDHDQRRRSSQFLNGIKLTVCVQDTPLVLDRLHNMLEKVVWVNDQGGRNAKVETLREVSAALPATPTLCTLLLHSTLPCICRPVTALHPLRQQNTHFAWIGAHFALKNWGFVSFLDLWLLVASTFNFTFTGRRSAKVAAQSFLLLSIKQ